MIVCYTRRKFLFFKKTFFVDIFSNSCILNKKLSFARNGSMLSLNHTSVPQEILVDEPCSVPGTPFKAFFME